MRNFSAVLELPLSCDCCGAMLPTGDLQIDRGTHRLAIREGDPPASIGNCVSVRLDGGRLSISLRRIALSKSIWAPMQNFDRQVFGEVKESSSGDWRHFDVELRNVDPHSLPTHAQLRFVEAVRDSYEWLQIALKAQNGAAFKLTLDSLE